MQVIYSVKEHDRNIKILLVIKKLHSHFCENWQCSSLHMLEDSKVIDYEWALIAIGHLNNSGARPNIKY